MQSGNEELSWFAAKLTTNRQFVMGTVARDGVQTYVTSVVPNILFIKSTMQYAKQLAVKCGGMVYFYRDPQRKNPGRIDEDQMRNFMLVTSAPEDCLIPLDEVSYDFLQGQRVRVTGGIFEGAEGVIKRIKGDRRLIVSITGVTCIATAFIHPSLLEPVEFDARHQIENCG